MSSNLESWHLESGAITGRKSSRNSCDDFKSGPLKKRQRQNHTVEGGLAATLRELSFRERETLYEEMHGVSGNATDLETPEFVEDKIQAMKAALSNIPKARRQEYDRALFLNPTLSNDIAFLNLFLRCERYVPEAAAERLCTHFQHKMELWGAEKLPHRISLEDFSEADMRCLRGGGIQFSPTPDSTGRKIIVFQVQAPADSWENYSRVFWYLAMSYCLDNPVGHASGYVSIANSHGSNLDDATKMFHILRKSLVYNEALPWTTKANHILIDNPSIKAPVEALSTMFKHENRIRMRFHSGSLIEICYALLTFGIRLDARALSSNSAIRHEIMDEYIEVQQRRENELKLEADQQLLEKGMVLYPSEKDVLMGKGKQCYNHPGNQLMRNKVQAYVTQYQEGADRLWKQALCMNLVSLLEEDGAKFLERKEDLGWTIADKQTSFKKISQCFRETIRKNSKIQG